MSDLKTVPERASVGEKTRKGTPKSHLYIWKGKDTTTLKIYFTESSIGQSYGFLLFLGGNSHLACCTTQVLSSPGERTAEVYNQQH